MNKRKQTFKMEESKRPLKITRNYGMGEKALEACIQVDKLKQNVLNIFTECLLQNKNGAVITQNVDCSQFTFHDNPYIKFRLFLENLCNDFIKFYPKSNCLLYLNLNKLLYPEANHMGGALATRVQHNIKLMNIAKYYNYALATNLTDKLAVIICVDFCEYI